MGLQVRILGQGEGTLSDSIPSDPSQGLSVVVTGDGTVQLVGTIPPNAKTPAHLSLSVDSGIWFVAIGQDPAFVVSAANAPYRLDAALIIGMILDNPRKGAILAIEPAATGALLRAEASWAV